MHKWSSRLSANKPTASFAVGQSVLQDGEPDVINWSHEPLFPLADALFAFLKSKYNVFANCLYLLFLLAAVFYR